MYEMKDPEMKNLGGELTKIRVSKLGYHLLHVYADFFTSKWVALKGLTPLNHQH